MIKINTKTMMPNREQIPVFLRGLTNETLLDLSWTDQALGVQDFAWWPEENGDQPINPDTHKYGAEILTPDPARNVVVISHEVVALTVDEVAEKVADAVTARLSELASYRYEVETAGVTMPDQSVVQTDRGSQAMVGNAKAFSDLNPATLIDYKTGGGWVQIDNATITSIANAVGDHVQKCFSTERAHAEAIEALTTVQAVVDYDITTGW